MFIDDWRFQYVATTQATTVISFLTIYGASTATDLLNTPLDMPIEQSK